MSIFSILFSFSFSLFHACNIESLLPGFEKYNINNRAIVLVFKYRSFYIHEEIGLLEYAIKYKCS